MKILYVHFYDAAYEMGGASRGVLDLVLGTRQTFGDEVLCAVNPGALAKELKKRGIPVVEIPSGKISVFRTLARLKKITDEFCPEIIHSHHRYSTFLLDLFFKPRYRILHTERVLKRDRRFLYRSGHFATTVSESLRQHLIRYYGVPENKVLTIPNAVAIRAPAPGVAPELEKKYPRKPGELRGLCTGRFEKQKGHACLIEAVAKLPASSRERIRIFFAGDGKLKDSLQGQIARLGIGSNFVFLGYTEEVPAWLTACDFLVLSSLWEGMPRAVIESFYRGKPVIATDIEGTRDIVQDKSNGLLVPPRDPVRLAAALQCFLDHPEEMKRMAEAALETGKELSFEKMIARYHDLYGRLLNQSLDPR